MVLANNNNSLPSALGQFLLMAKTGWKSRECLAVLSPGLQAAVRLQRTRLALLSGSSSPTTCRTRQCMACTIDELPKFPSFFFFQLRSQSPKLVTLLRLQSIRGVISSAPFHAPIPGRSFRLLKGSPPRGPRMAPLMTCIRYTTRQTAFPLPLCPNYLRLATYPVYLSDFTATDCKAAGV